MSVEVVSRAGPEDAGLAAPLFDAYRVFYGPASVMELAREFLRERLSKEESVVMDLFVHYYLNV